MGALYTTTVLLRGSRAVYDETKHNHEVEVVRKRARVVQKEWTRRAAGTQRPKYSKAKHLMQGSPRQSKECTGVTEEYKTRIYATGSQKQAAMHPIRGGGLGVGKGYED